MSAVWKYKLFETTKVDVVKELDEIENEHGREERVLYSLERVSELENSSPEGQLKRLIYIFSTLSQHVQFDVLSYEEAKGLFDLAYTLLLVHRVPNTTGKLSVLYGDFHTLKSLFAQKEGNFWKAAWQQNLSKIQSPTQNSGGEVYQNYLFGLKALRLGNTELALSYLSEDLKPDHQMFGYYLVNKIRAYRFRGDYEHSLRMIEDYSSTNDIDSRFQTELIWEHACINASSQKDINGIGDLVKAGSSHYKPSYILEYYLWSYCTSGFKIMLQLPKVRTLARKKELKLRSAGTFFKIVNSIEVAYDKSIPLVTRLQKLEEIFDKIKLLRNIDKEMLVWLALARWLDRNKQRDMAQMTLHEYAALSFRLSSGSNHDVLGLAEDLFKEYSVKNLLLE